MRFIRQTISSFIKLSLLLLVLGWGSSAYSADLISPADNATVPIALTTFTWTLGAGDTPNSGLAVSICSDPDATFTNVDEVTYWWSGHGGSTLTTADIDLSSIEAGTYYWILKISLPPKGWENAAEGQVYTLNVANAPTLSSSTPADDATAVAVDANIVLTFSEAVDVESGNITINTGGSTVAMIDVTSGLVTGTGTNTITINPASDLVANTNYNVLIDASAFDDSAGNSYAGITSTTALSFTTVSPSPAGTVTFDTAGTINGYVNSYSLGATNPSIGTLYIGPVNLNTASKVVAVGGDYGVGYHGSRTGMDSLQISTLNNSSNFGLSAFNVYNPSATTDYTLTITGYSDVVYWNSNETPICSTTGAATKNQWTTITVTGCDNVVTVIVEFTDDTELYFNDFVINEPID